MSRILHLSDIHLGPPTARQFLDQHKGTMASGDRRAEKHVLAETVSALEANGGLAGVEAVVVSGDLTNGAEQTGFTEFATLAERLVAHVRPEQILVVPGNHDVPREQGAGEPQRYGEFLRVTRELGFATPLLDGIDFDAAGRLEAEALTHPHVVTGERFVIVPLNSSHFCWGTEPLPDRVVESLLSVADPDEIATATAEIRRHDVPRVSNAQMSAVGHLLSGLDPCLRPSAADGRVWLGVLHHQLLPVSAREEFKSFESLTNLGAVREFLVALGIQVVLHGHKHESALYWDYVADQRRLSAPPARVLVTAAPGTFRPGLTVARVLEIGERANAPEVRIEDVCAAERRGGRIRSTITERARLWDGPATAVAAESRAVRGETASEVYARVQSVFDGVRPGEALRYLVCEIADSSGAERVPAGYPAPGDPAEVQAWMTDLVEWWQLPEPQLSHGVTFNHGDRIYKQWGNQVQRAAELLSAAVPGDAATTRAAILLLDPRKESSPQKGEFPSFVSVQLQLVRVGMAWRLDCTGYFRKQEMRYWWPINVAELAKVQRAVADGILIDEHHPRRGVLRTITAHAIAEERLPIVAVPAIDRAVDQRPENLWRMAYSLMEPEKVGNPGDVRLTWNRYLADLRPSAAPEEVPAMSRRGLQTVLKFVQAMDPHVSTAAVQALQTVVTLYGLFRSPDGAAPRATREAAAHKLDSLDRELDALFGEVPTAPATP